MKWNKSARLLAVAGLALATSVAWGQVAINGGGTNGTLTAPGATTDANGKVLGTSGSIMPTLTPTNGGAGINGAKGALSPVGGNGGPSGAFATYGAKDSTNAPLFGSGLAGTSHDFVTGTGSSGVANGAGLCTYCHTPHKAKSTLLLWNHTLSSKTFQWDVAATTSGTALPGFTGNAYNGPSAKCLSCHDGSVAIGDVGWFQEAAITPTANTGSNTDSGFKVGQTGKADGLAGSTTKQVGAGGNMSGNHPVAIPYPLNGSPNVYNGSTTGAQLATNDFVADPTANNIRLYSDVGGGAIVGKTTPGQTGIECSSCHDPHNKASKGDYFLRGNLSGWSQSDGYICLQCHVK